MLLEPKIKDGNVENLRKAYEDERMSGKEISRKSEELFGFTVNSTTVQRSLSRAGIEKRSLAESVSIATTTLDGRVSHLTEEVIEWTDGFLLGDGGINFRWVDEKHTTRFQIGSSQEQWATYAMSGLTAYVPSKAKESGEICEKRPNPIYASNTLTHPDILTQARRWYPHGIKIVPPDVRITKTSVMLWYLGDGSFHNGDEHGDSSSLCLATCGFTPDDIKNILIPKLMALGIESTWLYGLYS